MLAITSATPSVVYWRIFCSSSPKLMSQPVFGLEDLFSKSSGVPGDVPRTTLPLSGRLAALLDQAAGQVIVDELLFAA
jgi:hypothetical protein